MAMIENGVGGGDLLKINSLYEAHTFSITEAESLYAAGQGDAYNLNTGDITSLTAGDATLMYFKNDEDEDYIVNAIAVGLRGFTGLSDKATITVSSNPDGGDLISDATAISMNANRNFGSSKSLKTTTLLYKGKAAGTVTGGSDVLQFYQGEGRLYATIDLIIPRGSSLAIRVTSDATAGTCYAAIVGHLHTAR